jgi:hypothetical protein
MENKMDQNSVDTLKNVLRSTQAVIDAMTQRGAIRGEELTTIGKLRDDCATQLAVLEEYEETLSVAKTE